MENQQNLDTSLILCRIVDVNSAIQKSFQKFLEVEGKTLEDLANIMREELSTLELFTTNPATNVESSQSQP